MISTRLQGGLGNQMFQIANTISKGLEYKTNCFFRASSFTPMQGRDTSNYVTNIFRKLNVFIIYFFYFTDFSPWNFIFHLLLPFYFSCSI